MFTDAWQADNQNISHLSLGSFSWLHALIWPCMIMIWTANIGHNVCLIITTGCLPWVNLWVGWRRGEALPDCGCSGISRRGHFANCNVACPPTRRGGYNATKGYTSACPGRRYRFGCRRYSALRIGERNGERLWKGGIGERIQISTWQMSGGRNPAAPASNQKGRTNPVKTRDTEIIRVVNWYPKLSLLLALSDSNVIDYILLKIR